MQFDIDIEDPDYEEGWSDEIEIYHNPNALVPLSPNLFPQSAHFFLDDGELVWQGPERRVLFSYTRTLYVGGDDTISDTDPTT